MKKSRFTETQIVGILKEAESGLPMADYLRLHAAYESSALALVPEGVLSQVDRSSIDSRPIISPKFSRELGIISLKERELSNYAAVIESLIKKNLKLK